MASVEKSCFKATIWLPVLLISVLSITLSSTLQTLSCISRGKGVKWYLNTTELKNNNKDIEIDDSGVLNFLSTTKNLFGILKCIDQSTGKTLHQSSDEQRPAFITPMRQKNVVAVLGDHVQFNCEARGTQPFKYTWSYYGKTKNVRHANPSIQLPTNSKDDSGFYTCTASNRYGHVLQSVHLRIQEAPQLPPIIRKTTFRNKTSYIENNFTVTMDCFVMSEDLGTKIIWLKWKNNFDLEQLKQKVRDMSYQNESIFRSVKKLNYVAIPGLLKLRLTNNEAGCFTCLALNAVGYDYATMYVNLIEKPGRLRLKPAIDRTFYGNQTEFVGDDVSMDCNVRTGSDEIKFYWLKWRNRVDRKQIKRQAIEMGYSTSYYAMMRFLRNTIQSSSISISGDLTKRYAKHFTGYYTCVAVNPWGFDYSTRYLHLMNGTVIS